ncbi:Gfo/Idh/MocA family oxidoreductase [Candidatus Woesearchaeota archaeon]|nr:Gfo/Idh/MocA family oxidoreductase [Candidatus Woesearchaeota archaeon]
MTLNFGIIGCGNVSATYAYVFQKNPESMTVAVADTDLGKAQRLADTFGIPRVYKDYREMLTGVHLDAVVISTPHYLHHEQAIVCAEKKLALLCEKPLATTLEDTLDIIQKCSSVPFGTMLQRRFYPNTVAAAAAVRGSVLGDIKKASLDFSCHKSPEFYNSWRGKKISGGGVLLSQALHRIDQLVYIFGAPQSVFGATKITRPYLEVEDYAQGKVLFCGDITAYIKANNSSGNEETKSIITITGTKGKILLSDDKTPEWSVQDFPFPEELDINAIPTMYRPAYYGPAHEKVIDDFVNAIRNKRKPAITGSDSLPAMKIIFGLYESSATGKTVLLK